MWSIKRVNFEYFEWDPSKKKCMCQPISEINLVKNTKLKVIIV